MNLVLDIGGLSTKYMIFDNYSLVCRDTYYYNKLIDATEILKIVENIYNNAIKKYDEIENICISSLGVIDSISGKISGLGAIAGYNEINWKKFFSLQTKAPVYIENDANCAALYEISKNKNLQNAVLLVIGTGIGGAIIINRKLYKGNHFMAGEFGCSLETIKNNKYFNVSSQASTYSIINRYYQKTSIKKSGKEIFELYYTDHNAKRSIQQMAYHLAKLIVNLFFSLDVDVIIGGAISANTFFMDLLNKEIQKIITKSGTKQDCCVQPCHDYNDANLYGALSLINNDKY